MRNALLSLIFLFYSTITGALHAQQLGLDPTFGNEGIVIDINQDGSGYISNIVMLPDDRFVVASDSLERYSPDGARDYSYGVTDYKYSNNMLLQPDGKIITAGGLHLYPIRGGACRWQSNGKVDSNFAANGKITVDDSTDVIDALLQPDGKVILFGENSQKKYFALFRYLPNGTPDSSFGGTGRVFRYYEPFPVNSMGLTGGGLMADGRIVIGGDMLSYINTPDSFFAMRFMPDGTIDTSFNHRGIATVPGLWPCGAIAVQDDGKVLLAGHTIFGEAVPFTLTRINVDGSIDISFADAGIAVYQWQTGKENKVRVMKVQPDGKILLAGRVGSGSPPDEAEPKYWFALVRYLPNGIIDSSFGTNGSLLTKIGTGWDEIKDIALQSDGKIIAIGSTQSGNSTSGAIVRYLFGGQTDTGDLLTSATKIRLYPNPAIDKLYIGYPDGIAIRSVMLYDAIGRLLRQWDSKILEINISNKTKGAYVLRFVTATGEKLSKPFIILK